MPSHSGPYELQIEVQPKSHHRAHYETEGSRGAVKASAGGHPVVQVIAVLVEATLVYFNILKAEEASFHTSNPLFVALISTAFPCKLLPALSMSVH